MKSQRNLPTIDRLLDTLSKSAQRRPGAVRRIDIERGSPVHPEAVMGSLAEQVLTLNSTLEAIEVRFAEGGVPLEGLEALKSSVDDFRLRVWGVLAAAQADDYRAFQERFRIRRAKEICRDVGSDLRAGKMSGTHGELPDLAEAAGLLTRSINLALRQSAFDGGGAPA